MANEEFLKVWLRFNESATADECGNSWTAYNSPTISTANAINGNALQLSGGYKTNSELGQYLALDGGLTLGGQDFTIDFWSFMDSGIGSYARPFAIFNSFGSNSNKALLLELSGTGLLMCYDGSSTSVKTGLKGTLFHAAIVYEHSKSLLSFYINGTKVGTISKNFTETAYTYCFIGRANYKAGDTYYYKGTIDEFRIFDGVALWTDNFTPPTDYFPKTLNLGFDTLRLVQDTNFIPVVFSADTQRNIAQSVNLNFDTERKVKSVWRYGNYGTADLLSVSGTTVTDLPVTQSKTGSAFYQTARAKCFDIPATNEIWIKFDVYTTLSKRWRAYNQTSNGATGVCSQTSGAFDFWINDTKEKTFSSTVKNKLQTVLLHMISDSSSGVVEAWLDGEKLYTYTGKVNNGADFDNIYLQSDGAGTFFSNVIISNAEIGLDELTPFPVNFNFDTARKFSKPLSLNFDTERTTEIIINKIFDLQRILRRAFESEFGTQRIVIATVDKDFDTIRNLAHKLIVTPAENGVIDSEFVNTPNVQSIEIQIAAQQLTDQLSFTAINDADIMQQVKGQYLDYLFDMRVEKSSKRGILTTCRCCADVDRTLYCQFTYIINADIVAYEVDLQSKTIHHHGHTSSEDIDESKTEIRRAWATSHLNFIALFLGKKLVCRFKNFVSDLEVKQENITLQGLLNNLFSWTARLPHMLINCYIRDDTLYVIQRGYEQNVIDLTNAAITLPVINKELVRTTWGSSPNDDYTLNHHYLGWKIAVPPPKWSEDRNTYYFYKQIQYGYLLTKSHSFGGWQEKKIDGYTIRRPIINVTAYKYTAWMPYELIEEVSTSVALGTERYNLTDPVFTGELISYTRTEHNTLTPSQSHTVEYDEDGNLVGSVVGSHVAGFYDNYATLEEEHTESENRTIQGNPLIDPNFPVIGDGALAELTSAVKWLNRKTKETVSFDVYDYPHVFDLNDRIILNGNEYFLESNTVTKTPRIVNQQSLVLVRWY